MSKQRDYANKVYEAALALGIPEPQARLAAAQSSIETGYGDAAPGNAYFGIKAGSSWDGATQNLTTHEEVGGKRVKITDAFRAYEKPEDSLADWWATLQRRWPEAATATSFEDAVAGLKTGKKGGYATASDYPQAAKYVSTKFLPPRPPMDIPGSLSAGLAKVGAAAAPPPLPRPRPSAPNSAYTLPPPALPLNLPIPKGPQSYWDSRNTVQPGMMGRGLPTPPVAASVQMAAPRPPSLPVPATNFAMLPNTGPVAAPTMADTRAEQALMRRPAPPLPAGALAGLNGIGGGVAGSIPAPAAPMPLPRPTLPRPAVQGSPQVSALQQQLAASGYSPGKVDGIFGSKTDAAVRAFQQANGLSVDGIVGPKTMAALQKTQAPTPMPRPAPLPTVPVPSNGGNIFGNLLGGAMNTLGGLKDQAGNAITNVTQNVVPSVQNAVIQTLASTPGGRGLVIDPIINSIGKSPTRVMPAPPPGKPAGYGSKGYSVNSAKAAMPWAF